MKERLVELLRKKDDDFTITCPRYEEEATLINCIGCQYDMEDGSCDYASREADYLLENGAIVPPDELYSIVDKGTIYATISKAMVDWLPLYVIKEPEKYGYYKTREQAEAKLKEGGEEWQKLKGV